MATNPGWPTLSSNPFLNKNNLHVYRFDQIYQTLSTSFIYPPRFLNEKIYILSTQIYDQLQEGDELMIMKGFKHNKLNLMAALAGVLLLLLAAGLASGQSPVSDGSGAQGCYVCEQEDPVSRIDTESPAPEPAASESSIFGGAPDDVAVPDKLGTGPVAVILVSPSNTIESGNPTYTWIRATDADYYALEVRNSLRVSVIKQWFIGAETSGSETPSITLSSGTYTWRILAWNSGGYTWSNEKTFSVCASSSLPGKATLISPKGTIGTAKPAYQWKTVNAATRYHLKVTNTIDPNTPIIDEWYEASEVVKGQNSYITPDKALAAGTYKWWIQTGNCNAEGPWSSYATFKFANVSPGRPTAVSPRGLISTSNPIFVWTTVKNAAGYNLEVQNGSGVVYTQAFSAEEVTSGSKCSARLDSVLPDDDIDYYWMVQAYNDAGTGAWSSLKHFEIVCRSSSSKLRQERQRIAR